MAPVSCSLPSHSDNFRAARPVAPMAGSCARPPDRVGLTAGGGPRAQISSHPVAHLHAHPTAAASAGGYARQARRAGGAPLGPRMCVGRCAEMGEGQASVRLSPAPRVPDRQARPLPPPLRAQARRMKAFARAGIAAAVRRTGLYAALGRSAWRRGIVILLYHRVGAPAAPAGGPSVRGEPPPQASSPEGRACAAQLPLRLRRRPSHLCRR